MDARRARPMRPGVAWLGPMVPNGAGILWIAGWLIRGFVRCLKMAIEGG